MEFAFPLWMWGKVKTYPMLVGVKTVTVTMEINEEVLSKSRSKNSKEMEAA